MPHGSRPLDAAVKRILIRKPRQFDLAARKSMFVKPTRMHVCSANLGVSIRLGVANVRTLHVHYAISKNLAAEVTGALKLAAGLQALFAERPAAGDAD